MGYTALFEAMMYCCFFTIVFKCKLDLWTLFQFSINLVDIKNKGIFNDIKVINFPFFGFNSYIFIHSMYLALLFHTMIFVDLYLSLRNPFYQKEKRFKFYYLFILIVMIIVGSFMYKYSEFLTQDLDIFSDIAYYDKKFLLVLRIILSCLCCITLISFGLILRIICKKGTSNKLRIKVIKNIFFWIANYMVQIVEFYIMLDNKKNNINDYFFILLGGYMFAYILISEPFVIYNLKDII